MGLYDKYFKDDNVLRFNIIKMTSEEAYMVIMVCSLKSNDIASRGEMRTLEYILTRFRGFFTLNPTDFQHTIDKFMNIIDSEGVDTLLKAAKGALEENLKEPAFINAVDIIMSDGIVDTKEKEFLEKLQKMLGVPDERVEQIVDILQAKNRGSSAEMLDGKSSDKMFYT